MTAAETLVAGRYRLRASLGAGGMGRVWLARDEVLRRDVAIKEIALPFGLTDDERAEMRERTLREARAAGRLNHPNVIRVYDVHHGQEQPWIVMEYVPSRSLLEVIKARGPLPSEQVAGIGLAVLSALNAASQVGVLHRDVKPSNVLIADDGRVVLTDFGSAMIDENEGALTRTGVILGSPRYIAPERARDGIATPESDLWSLGATMYEAVEGRAPYTRETTLETLIALATEKPDPVRLAGPLKPVLTGLLQKNPKDRMRAKEVEERLRQIADVGGTVRLAPAPASYRPADLAEVMRLGRPWTPEAVVSSEASVYLDRDVVSAPAEPSPTTAAPAKPSAPTADPLTVPVRSQPRPRPSDRRGPRRRIFVAGGAVSVAAVALGAIALVVTPDGEAKAPTGAAVQAANGPASGGPSAASAASNALPSGFRWYQAKTGFRVAVPVGWTKLGGETRSSVRFCYPGGPPLLHVREWQPSDPDLSLALAREESDATSSTPGSPELLPGYQRVRMEVSPQQDGGLWEYTFKDPKMGPMVGLDRVVVAAGRAYIIRWQAPAATWGRHVDTLGVVTNSFRPVATARSDAPPNGFTSFTSQTGFRVATPSRLRTLDVRPASAVFAAASGSPHLAVREWEAPEPNLFAALARKESAERRQMPNYRRVSMEVLEGQDGAVWEYTFTDRKLGRMHGVERAFVAAGRAYLIQWRTSERKWTESLSDLGVVTASFRPAGAV